MVAAQLVTGSPLGRARDGTYPYLAAVRIQRELDLTTGFETQRTKQLDGDADLPHLCQHAGSMPYGGLPSHTSWYHRYYSC